MNIQHDRQLARIAELEAERTELRLKAINTLVLHERVAQLESENAELEKQLAVEVGVGARLVDENEAMTERIAELEAEVRRLHRANEDDEAIEAYGAEQAADAGLLWIKTADLGLLHAKVAVCDAYRRWDYDPVHDGHSGLRDALLALRELEKNKP